MRSDLLDGVDAELQLGRPDRSRARPWPTSSSATRPSRPNYAVRAAEPVRRRQRRLPTGRHRRSPTLPDLSGDRPAGHAAASRSPSPSESGPLKWRFVAGRVTGATDATFVVGIPLRHGERTP